MPVAHSSFRSTCAPAAADAHSTRALATPQSPPQVDASLEGEALESTYITAAAACPLNDVACPPGAHPSSSVAGAITAISAGPPSAFLLSSGVVIDSHCRIVGHADTFGGAAMLDGTPFGGLLLPPSDLADVPIFPLPRPQPLSPSRPAPAAASAFAFATAPSGAILGQVLADGLVVSHAGTSPVGLVQPGGAVVNAQGVCVGTAHRGTVLLAPDGTLVAVVSTAGDVLDLFGRALPGAEMNHSGEVHAPNASLIGVTVVSPKTPNAVVRCACPITTSLS
jgi:hypothetical protein